MLEDFLQDDLSLFALPLYLAAVLVEAWHAHRHQSGRYRLGDTLASFSMLAASAIVELLPRLLALAAFVYLHEVSPLRDVIGRQWWAWLLLFVLDDFSYYWFHRANHEVRLLWAGHVNHHSSQYLNFGTALRQGVGERVHKFLFWMWLPLLGFDPAMIVTVISLNLFYQFWIHTRAVGKLHPWIEAVFNTPSHHRVHHGSNVRYLDRNHGGVLIIWDRLFGTFADERDDEPVVYGLTTNINSDNPWTVLSHEYRAIWRDLRRANHWGDRLRILFLAPGWSADGPDKRASVLRAQAGMH
ncbi:MAG TPA: sterol desaturase family protein [Haliea salexigens]|uniref:Sterol desaturase family protein n=1 Tax=Haliea salexigens TaxID=287487 RepID=A0A3C1KRQ9_9GAMM|nr:sterol desaturase [Haliea sp.]HAN29347.1 sterol desaturase family protein [Haliea salexigens]|tara:strand:- start:843 stop:1736 length:894 start_codon:yes stop_codon:yes gene_type:complete